MGQLSIKMGAGLCGIRNCEEIRGRHGFKGTMAFLRLVAKPIRAVIYAVFVVILLYFPTAELLAYLGRETRLFTLPPMMPAEDALLPCLVLALVYGAIAAIRSTIEPSDLPGDSGKNPPNG